jgi:hypothetical protein
VAGEHAGLGQSLRPGGAHEVLVRHVGERGALVPGDDRRPAERQRGGGEREVPQPVEHPLGRREEHVGERVGVAAGGEQAKRSASVATSSSPITNSGAACSTTAPR